MNLKLLISRSIFLVLMAFGNMLHAQNVPIVDFNFKSALIQMGIDLNKDGYIQVSEAMVCDSLNLKAKNIADLSGVEAFTSLTYLNCVENKLETLNLTQNKKLIKLECQFNKINSLSLGSNQNLITLYCNNNMLKTIDVSNCPNLVYFFCSHNVLEQLDISKNLKLFQFNCEINNLKQICVNEKQFYENWGKDNTAEWVTTCVNSVSTLDSKIPEPYIIAIFDMMGRKILNEPLVEGLYIYAYSNGAFVKRWHKSNW